MALDGIFLHCLKNEIEGAALDCRVEKIHQPSREELLLHLRGREGLCKLLLSAKADAPRIHFTQNAPENPAVPPMFCMLLRKHLMGARLKAIRQDGLERVLFLDFQATNELGDKVYPTLVIEIMARHSNLIFIDENQRIIDAVKRIDDTKSSVREILPGLKYELPPAQAEKKTIFDCNIDAVADMILQSEKKLSKAFQSVLQGVSPAICKELAYLAAGEDTGANLAKREGVLSALQHLQKNAAVPAPYMLLDTDQKPFDYAFCQLSEFYGCGAQIKYPSFSELLDAYYYQRARADRIHQRAQDLFKQLTVLQERAVRKAAAQREQLKACEKKDTLKEFGDLVSANLYCLEKGSLFYEVQNFYDPELPFVRISADPALSPNQNAQKYYKEYRKLQTAQTMLADFIQKAEDEAVYLESVIDALSRGDTEREITEIREELYQGGYLKRRKTVKQKQPKPLPPILVQSKDGASIRVGRNNVQNDKLTLRDSKNYDTWFHVKDIPGSHVVVAESEETLTQQTIYDAAMLAAYYSKGSSSSNVAVDYTLIKNVKKPQGAKPGKVVYETYHTVYVTPSEAYIQSLMNLEEV